MTIKYLLVPGYVTSKEDSDKHCISARDLIHLYGVDPEECDTIQACGAVFAHQRNLVQLHPSWDGNYTLPQA